MKLLVTGATGFVGGAVARAAAVRGDEIAVLVRGDVTRSLPQLPNVVRVPGTLRAPDWDAIERFAPDAVIHCAWIATPGIYLESPENVDWRDQTVAFLDRLLDAGLRHAVALGTCIEYAPSREPLSETSVLAPQTLYAKCKDATRQALEGRSLCWARLFHPYGPGEDGRRIASAMIPRLLRREPIVLKTPHAVRDYIFIDDVVGALLAAVDRRAVGALNVGSGEGIAIRDLITELGRVVGVPADVRYDGAAAVDPDDAIVADVGRLRALGWSPHVPLHDGLRQLYQAVHPTLSSSDPLAARP